MTDDGKTNPARISKFLPDGTEVEMSAEEQESALGMYVKYLSQQAEDRQRRANFGDYREIVSHVREGTRFIGIGSSVYHAPASVIPMRFFTRFAMSILGDDWNGGRLASAPTSPHPIAVWARDGEDHFKNAKPDQDGTVRLMPNAAMIALARLGYEAFIVQTNTDFRDEVFERMRDMKQFHAARHEVSVGAFLTMAGFKVRYLPEEAEGKTPDMIASHPTLSLEFAVEAKRRYRNRGTAEDPRGLDGKWKLKIRNSIRKAMKQVKTKPRPWMIGVDLDLPCPIPDNPIDECFLDEVLSELKSATGSEGLAELLLLIQLPYHSSEEFSLEQTAQIISVQTPSSLSG